MKLETHFPPTSSASALRRSKEQLLPVQKGVGIQPLSIVYLLRTHGGFDKPQILFILWRWFGNCSGHRYTGIYFGNTGKPAGCKDHAKLR